MTHRHKVKTIIQNCKREYFLRKFETVTSGKELFMLSDHLLGRERTMPLPSGTEIDLCERFVTFFNDKIANVRLELDNQPVSTPSYDKFTGTSFDKFNLVSLDEILKLLKNSSTKTCALDPIPTSLMFQCLETLAPFIADVINQSLATGTVPDCYKHAIVKPMLKKPGLDENALKNFRPISNLKFLSKILEKLVLKQLLEHLNKSNVNEVFQSACKAFHSTETALLKVTSDVLESIDQKEICVMTLLDLFAAFDTIDRNILLTRLNQTFGLSGTVLQWFESYLSN
ncbi:reverse transcriptase-like protein [Elysia marginata]|uniref:Reverse transcriptase-like protein n=1 Tax=Elysia marginata TaxID=1093978 RepID=A0AAV4IG05_9GAST|nr:reverse transcriptase-like protein [Elysia marginata]